ncbi:unnamed protein product [Cyprideis torosa]|uniref:Uncharacterized protein n=1 Tax=Cyprideis torosa TaxID=163714 RepID=A0A7R8ZIP9_9CRUS|nr:unnamed protein product [Cyprideis torosa]CAG0885198.1 unnamed protein product [Cyprideis torosa]
MASTSSLVSSAVRAMRVVSEKMGSAESGSSPRRVMLTKARSTTFALPGPPGWSGADGGLEGGLERRVDNTAVVMFKQVAYLAVVFAILIRFYVRIYPSRAWEPYEVTDIPLTGVYAPNDALKSIAFIVDVAAPESFDIRNGKIYAGQKSKGNIVEIDLDTSTKKVVATLGAAEGTHEVLLPTGTLVKNIPVICLNDVAILRDDGKTTTYVLSESSTTHAMEAGILEMLSSGSGRVFLFNPAMPGNARFTVLGENLHFPNGIEVLPDAQTIIVSETARRRVLKYSIRENKWDVFAELPGGPDGIRKTEKGKYLVTVPLIQGPNGGKDLITYFSKIPPIRFLVSFWLDSIYTGIYFINEFVPNTFTASLSNKVISFDTLSRYFDFSDPYSLVVELDVRGKVLRTFSGRDPGFRRISQAMIYDKKLILGSYEHPFLAVLQI